MRWLKGAALFAVFALLAIGCKGSSGTKDAGDYCEDVCATLVDCPNCGQGGPDPNDTIPDSMDTCIHFNKFAQQGIILTNRDLLESFCFRACSEVDGEQFVVTPKCDEAYIDLWKCNSQATCDQAEVLPMLFANSSGLFFPVLGNCVAEAADARAACADDNLE